MVQLESTDRHRLISDEPQHPLQRFSFRKQPMDHRHFGQTHFGGNDDRGQCGADLGRIANHSPLVAEKRQSQPGRSTEITGPRSLALARQFNSGDLDPRRHSVYASRINPSTIKFESDVEHASRSNRMPWRR